MALIVFLLYNFHASGRHIQESIVKYWLIKTDFEEYPAEYWAKDKVTVWDGVRNYQARNYILKMNPPDKILLYETGCRKPAIRAVGQVCGRPFPDPTQFDPSSKYYDPRSTEKNPRWYAIELKFCKKIFVDKNSLKKIIAGNDIFKQSRLSVIPLTEEEFLKLTAFEGG